MSISYAVLLDGGFLLYKLRSLKTPVDTEKIASFVKQVAAHPCVAGIRLHRIYYYDAKPLGKRARHRATEMMPRHFESWIDTKIPLAAS